VNRVSSGRRTMEVLADDPQNNPGSTSDVLLYHKFTGELLKFESTNVCTRAPGQCFFSYEGTAGSNVTRVDILESYNLGDLRNRNK